MSNIMWEKIKEEFQYNSCASVGRLKVRRPISGEPEKRNVHYVLHTDSKYPAAFLLHEDEFGDMFGRSLQKRINEVIKAKGFAWIEFALEVE